jgi:hypothetical protein
LARSRRCIGNLAAGVLVERIVDRADDLENADGYRPNGR